MGILVEGQWRDEELPAETGQGGDFQRSESQFRNWITADGSSGFKAEAGRYHLYIAHNCPWAHRVLIYRAIKKLDRAITVAYSKKLNQQSAFCSAVWIRVNQEQICCWDTSCLSTWIRSVNRVRCGEQKRPTLLP